MSVTSKRMVMVHGWGFGPVVWQPVLPLFANFNPFTWHLPGYADVRSQPIPNFDPNFGNAVSPHGKLIGMGWSLGGQQLLKLAAAAPHCFDAIILVSTNARFTSNEQWPYGVSDSDLRGWEQRVDGNAVAALRRFARLCVHGADSSAGTLAYLENCIDHLLPEQSTLQSGLNALSSSDLRDDLRQTLPRTLLIGGSQDHLVPTSALQAMHALNSELKVAVITGAGHAPFLSHGEQFRDRVLEFLA